MPRLPELTREQLPDAERPIYDEIAESRGRVSGPFPVLLNSPEIAVLVARLGHRIRIQSRLEPWVYELAVLTATRERDCLFPWGAHQANTLKAGLGPEVVAAVRNRTAPAGLSERQALVVSYVQELLRRNRVSQATYDAVASWLGAQGVTDLTATIGYYSLLTCILNAFEVPPPEGADILPL